MIEIEAKLSSHDRILARHEEDIKENKEKIKELDGKIVHKNDINHAQDVLLAELKTDIKNIKELILRQNKTLYYLSMGIVATILTTVVVDIVRYHILK